MLEAIMMEVSDAEPMGANPLMCRTEPCICLARAAHSRFCATHIGIALAEPIGFAFVLVQVFGHGAPVPIYNGPVNGETNRTGVGAGGFVEFRSTVHLEGEGMRKMAGWEFAGTCLALARGEGWYRQRTKRNFILVLNRHFDSCVWAGSVRRKLTFILALRIEFRRC